MFEINPNKVNPRRSTFSAFARKSKRACSLGLPSPHLKIKKADIVVGIPSYNEADTISNVVKKVDAGLEKYFKDKTAVIINADNNSPDDTQGVFLNTKTKAPKIYISTPSGATGKGNNLRNIFLKVKDLEACGAMIVDADIKNIKPEWVKCLISPVLKGYDYVSPIFYRDKHDGSITNHICFPLVYGLLGHNIRQPIAGEIGFSRALAEYWLKQKWTGSVKQFGIDIFMTLNAIKGGFRFCRADLGAKIHKFSGPDLDHMFLEVTGILFQLLSENKDLWQKEINFHGLPLVCRVKDTKKYPELELDYRKFAKIAFSEFGIYQKSMKKYISPEIWNEIEKRFSEEKFLTMDSNLWTRIVYEMLSAYQNNLNKKAIIKFLRVFYFARMASFIKETSQKSPKEAEQIIQRQAQRFYRNRNYSFKHDYEF